MVKGRQVLMLIREGVDMQHLQCAAHVAWKFLSGAHSEPLFNLLH